MAEQSADGENDWVKQMLAEAMLGRSTLPASEPVEESTDGDETSAVAEPGPPEEPEVRYQVVLDEPLEPSAVPDASDDATAAVAASPAVADAVVVHVVDAVPEAPLIIRPPVRYEVVLDEPDAKQAEIVEPSEASPGNGPAPAVTSRLFERPNFDATNDPGVDEMLADERSEQVGPENSPQRSRMRSAIEWIVVLGSAVVVALLLRAFLFQAFFIPSESMESTLRVDDRVLVNKLSYRFGDVERGEVVVFRRPEDQPGEFRDLIKRVIGLPGETIEARGNTILIDGKVLIEPYLTPGEIIDDFGPVVIPEGEYFMMGDNRDNSGDSRVFGTIEEDRLIGRAFFLFWPFDRLGSL